MSISTLRIATRKSQLALWQAYYVRDQLQQYHPDLKIEIHKMVSRGDKILDTPLAKIGGKGLFLKELEHSMLAGETDIAVHSMKDVPVEFPQGLKLAVICPREDPRDAFVSNHYPSLDELPRGAVVGTCSLRRRAQLLLLRPDLKIRDLRGNVNTRLEKLDAGDFDAIILAAAGLIRLQMATRIRSFLTIEQSLPAIGQGAVGIECRSADSNIEALLKPLADVDTSICVRAERAMNQKLEGGCQVPIAGHAWLDDGRLHLKGLVASIDGQRVIYAEDCADTEDAQALGIEIAERLLQKGAGEILASLNRE